MYKRKNKTYKLISIICSFALLCGPILSVPVSSQAASETSASDSKTVSAPLSDENCTNIDIGDFLYQDGSYTGYVGDSSSEAASDSDLTGSESYFSGSINRYQATVRWDQNWNNAITALVAGMKNQVASIDVSSYKIPVSEEAELMTDAVNSTPSLFYVESSFYAYSNAKYVTEILPTYDTTDLTARKQAYETAVNKALQGISSDMSDYQKALVLHDYLVVNCQYAFTAGTSTPDETKYSAYDALVGRSAICNGYMLAYKELMQRCNIPVDTVSSNEMNHTWNAVQIGGKWYQVDCTWDDPTQDIRGRVSHDFFLKSDTVMQDSSHNHYSYTSPYTYSSTTYDGSQFYDSTDSAVYYDNGSYIYMKQDPNNSYKYQLIRRNGTTNAETVLKTGATTWNYVGDFSGLAYYRGDFYYDTGSSIKTFDPDTSTETTFYNFSGGSSTDIYGMDISDGTIYYVTASSPSSTLTVRQLSIGGDIATDVPADGVELTYNGYAQSGVPESTAYTRTGAISEAEVGNYTTAVRLNSGYVWYDGSSDDKTITWSVSKSAGYITLDQSSVSVRQGESTTVTINSKSSSSVSASSADSAYATATVSGNNVTINGIKATSGYVNITVTAAASNGYRSASTVVSVYVLAPVSTSNSGTTSGTTSGTGTSSGTSSGTDTSSGTSSGTDTTSTTTGTVTTVTVYRMYCSINGEHLYTTDVNERNTLSVTPGWTYEGAGWYAPSTGTPVYRLYSPGQKNHLYTTDANEIKVLTTQYGWTVDNNSNPLFYSGGTVGIYRLYNEPLQGMHLLTTDANEYSQLPSMGPWQQEGQKLLCLAKG